MNLVIFSKKTLCCLILIMMTSTVFAAPDNDTPDQIIKVAVRSHSGIEATKNKWTKTIDVLSQKISGYRFELVPIVGFHEMRTAAKNKKVDFILTNPYAYTELNKQSGVTRLLTLNKKQPNGVASTEFAAVIFTRSNRSDINYLDDIFNTHIMGVDKEAFGGWLMGLRELIKNGIDPHEEGAEVSFTEDNTHHTVVYSVLNGQADIGVVRTGILEQLVEQGKIKSDSIKVLNSHQDELPALHSTQHYPEWPFSVMPHVSDELSNEVFHVLLEIQPDSAAAITGKYINWAAPLDYSEVYSLVDELEQQHITFEALWDKHWLAIILAQLFVAAIVFYTIYLFSINKKLEFSKHVLAQHREHLEDVVERRTEELAHEKLKAEEANRAKSDFLSNMSHELRTPLNAILGFGQLMKMDAEDENDKALSDNADEILVAGKYLLSLINEILDLAKIESGKVDLEMEEVPCNEILKQSLKIIAPLSNEKNISINIDGCSECFVTADRKRLQQILINLLSNAVKYNNHDGHIDVVLGKNELNHCEFRIKDSGLGIKPEFHDQVFQPFARDAEVSEEVEGTGVGLVISKHLVEQMQGLIGFNSEYGLGTEFWVQFPAVETLNE